jgi:transcriptional regulator with XRE-family HTH domain
VLIAGGGVAERKGGQKEKELTAFGRYINRRINELRVDDPGLTKDRVARLAGMSRQHLWRSQRGDAVLSVYEVAQLARILRLPAEEVYDAFWKSTSLGPGLQPWPFAEMQEYLRAHHGDIGPDAVLLKDQDSRYVLTLKPDHGSGPIRELSDDEYARAAERHAASRAADASRVYGYALYRLPQNLKIMAEEFRLEAIRGGADEQELTFIDSVLASPEAIFRQNGYRGQTLTEDEQRSELENVIAMLRQWLVVHMKQREGARK